jgi:hypothetical protein
VNWSIRSGEKQTYIQERERERERESLYGLLVIAIALCLQSGCLRFLRLNGHVLCDLGQWCKSKSGGRLANVLIVRLQYLNVRVALLLRRLGVWREDLRVRLFWLRGRRSSRSGFCRNKLRDKYYIEGVLRKETRDASKQNKQKPLGSSVFGGSSFLGGASCGFGASFLGSFTFACLL